jgi:hypothetical protein
MAVHIDEMTTHVDVAPAEAAPPASATTARIVAAVAEELRRAAEWAARRAARTRAEGFDD